MREPLSRKEEANIIVTLACCEYARKHAWLIINSPHTHAAFVRHHLRPSEQAVGVVTGGIAEMFVSRKKEALTGIRRGFAHIAIKVRLNHPDRCGKP